MKSLLAGLKKIVAGEWKKQKRFSRNLVILLCLPLVLFLSQITLIALQLPAM